MKISKEDKIRILFDAIDGVIAVPYHLEDQMKEVLRNALRTIEREEENRA
ncbi:MAG: hypothetical protein PWP16_1896 [Eubacteriaceae bacterium]|jgi:hypothetical protein|nr:hypothetical protein [Eubacteriaceae bacterium]MDK2935858.1 hypothetical protein [Eubacteriaceae bacterium]MDN5308533.1 hypothetical protein [Eubacteriaceae bacterium]